MDPSLRPCSSAFLLAVAVFLAPLLLGRAAAASETPVDRFDAAATRFDSVLRDAPCPGGDRRCLKSLAGLSRQLDRAGATDGPEAALKTLAKVVKKAARVIDAVTDGEWLVDYEAAEAELVDAAAGLGSEVLSALESTVDVYGSPLGRSVSRVRSLAGKMESAQLLLEADASRRGVAAFLKRVAKIRASGLKLASSIDRLVERRGLVAVPAQEFTELLYERALESEGDVADWVMEGPGEITFEDGWMALRDPARAGHHVFWCPVDFPESFAAEWELQNLDTRAGLLIVFFGAVGRGGEDLFDPGLRTRGGVFDQYIRGDIDNYHTSYYANTPSKPDRRTSRLRKNRGFRLLQSGPRGIPADSEAVHQVRLIKDRNRIKLFVDERKILDFTDNRNPLGAGKIGFRQMQWSHFRYRNFRVLGAE